MKIQHWLLPTRKNNFHPHALRPFGLVVFLAIFVTIPFLYNVTSAKQAQVLGYATSISVSDLYALTNQERAANGLGAFSLNSQLSSAAVNKANHMFANNYWAHVAPDGTTPWSFIYAAGYDYSAAGENLAKDFNTSSGTVAGWMGSSTHRANILSSSYNDVGFAVVNGTLLGSQTTLVVAMYGAEAAPAPTPAPTSTPAPTPPATPAVTSAEPVASTPDPASVQPIVEETPAPATQQAVASPEEETEPQNPTTTVTPTAELVEVSGQVEGIATLLPVKVYNSMNWGQKASLVLISVLMLLFVMKHTLVWRQQKKGLRHIWLRSHPVSQLTILSAAFVITLLTSTGAVL